MLHENKGLRQKAPPWPGGHEKSSFGRPRRARGLRRRGFVAYLHDKAGIQRRRPERGFSWAHSPPDSKPPRRASRGSRTLAYFPVCFLDAPERRPGVSPWRSGVDLRAPFAACGPQARRPRAGQSNDREPARQPQFPRGHHQQGPRLHLRHDAARRRAIARRVDDAGGEARSRRHARRDGRRHHRGRISDRLRRRFRSRVGHRQAGEERHASPGSPARPSRTSTAAPRP